MDTPTPPVPPEKVAWPTHCASLKELHAWLNKLTTRDGVPVRIVLGMRLLVLNELDRTAPEPAEKKPSAGFTHAEPTLFSQKLPNV